VKKAQEELDRVVGSDRLPQLSDQEDLPYISALIKELLRWTCPLPLGLPKRVTEDDIYKGYFIPAGTTILENIWQVLYLTRWRWKIDVRVCLVYRGICYDDEVYPQPQLFDPERFLKDGKLDRSVKDPEDRVFGAGRRYDYARAMVLTLTAFFFFSVARICPGRYFALRSLFLNVSRTLSVFDIEAPVGEKPVPKFHESHIR